MMESSNEPYFQTYAWYGMNNEDESCIEYINVGGCLYYSLRGETNRLVYLGDIVEWEARFDTEEPGAIVSHYYCKIDFRHNVTLVAIRNSARISDPSHAAGLGQYEDEYKLVKKKNPRIKAGRNLYISQYSERVND